MRRIIQPFNIVERVLRDRIAYFAEIARSEELPYQAILRHAGTTL